MRGIGFKIAMVTVGCLLFAGAVSAIAVDRIARSSMERIAIARLQKALAHEADEVLTPVLTGDHLGLQEILARSAGGKDELRYAFVVSEKGAVLASTYLEGVPRDILHAHRLPPGTVSDVKVLATERGLVLDVAQALLEGRAGEIHRGVQAAEISEVAQTTVNTLLWVQAAALLLAVLASFLLADRLARPLGRLLAAVRRVGAGDLAARAGVESRDEIGQLGTAFDVMTEELRAARDAQEQMAARARGIVSCSPTALLVTDPSARILSANPAAEALTGASEAELRGRGLAELFVAGPEKNPIGDLGPVLGQQGVTLSYEMSLRHPGGKFLPVAFHSAPMRNGDAAIRGYVVEVRDLSHLRSSIEALKRQRDLLEESEADLGKAPSARPGASVETHLVRSERLVSLGQLAASVAHEVNNPIFGILTCAKVLERDLGAPGAAPDRLLKGVRTILSEATRCSETLRRFLDFARAEPPRRQEVALSHILEDVRDLLAPKAAEQGVSISCDLAAPDAVLGDPAQLHQAFLNVALNAVQAMPHGGTLAIRARPLGGDVEVALRDTGTGIRPEDLDRVFEPFFTTKEKGVGTGLGLAIARAVVTRHGGRIALSSEPGRGTEVTVTLPLADVPAGKG